MNLQEVLMFGILFFAIISVVNNIVEMAYSLDEIYFGKKIDFIITVIVGIVFYSIVIFVLGLIVYYGDVFINFLIS